MRSFERAGFRVQYIKAFFFFFFLDGFFVQRVRG